MLALAGVLNIHRLSQNGYANTFYSAGVRSMTQSLHNFLFASFDPGGLVTIDKPPLGMWVQVASAKLFGFSPMSLLLPEAIIGVLAVALLYRVVAQRFGPAAGLGSALALAVFPSFVAVSRDNGVDPLLILLMLTACAAGLRAIETGRLRPLLLSAVLVGLAFNTKTLAAFLVVPGIALAHLLCAPGRLHRRLATLALATLALAAVCFSWIALVELTPASQRPFVGSSTNNTELNLTFAYNGFGRVQGQIGGPGEIPKGRGALPLSPREVRKLGLAPAHIVHSSIHQPPPTLLHGRDVNPIAFGGSPGPLRLFGYRLADQGSWMLPFACFGLLALALLLMLGSKGADGEGYGGRAGTDGSQEDGRDASGRASLRDPRVAATIVLGGWFLCEVVVLSGSHGIVHPYYISALGPGVAAMVGAGALAMAQFARRRDWRMVLIPCAVLATAATEILILREQHYLRWLWPVIAGGALLGLCAMALPRLARPAMAFTVCVLALAPAAYARTTWLAPVEGTFPAAGPHQAIGIAPYGASSRSMRANRMLLRYVRSHRPGTRFAVLTDASQTAAPLILLGLPAGALAGYSGTDPALDGPGLARLVRRHEARYILLGGAFASRGGNLATVAVLRACAPVPPSAWHHGFSIHGLALFDCAGRERALSAA